MPLAPRAYEYPDAAPTMAIILHAHSRRRDVPVRPVQPAGDIFGRARLKRSSNRDVRQSNSAELVYPRNGNWRDGGKCGIQPHGRKHVWRLGLCKAGISLAHPAGQFQLLPGCDRTLSTCTNLFNNVILYGGFPYIPTPETAV